MADHASTVLQTHTYRNVFSDISLPSPLLLSVTILNCPPFTQFEDAISEELPARFRVVPAAHNLRRTFLGGLSNHTSKLTNILPICPITMLTAQPSIFNVYVFFAFWAFLPKSHVLSGPYRMYTYVSDLHARQDFRCARH